MEVVVVVQAAEILVVEVMEIQVVAVRTIAGRAKKLIPMIAEVRVRIQEAATAIARMKVATIAGRQEENVIQAEVEDVTATVVVQNPTDRAARHDESLALRA